MPFPDLFSSRRRRNREFQRHLDRREGTQAADPVAEWRQRNAGAEYREGQRESRRQDRRRRARERRERSEERWRQRNPPRQPLDFTRGAEELSTDSEDSLLNDMIHGIRQREADDASDEARRQRRAELRRAAAGPAAAGIPPAAAAPQPARPQMFDDFDDAASMGYAATLGRTGLPPRDLDPTRQDVADREILMDRYFNDPMGGADINPYLYQGPYGEMYDVNNPYDDDYAFGFEDDGGYTFPARGPGMGMGGGMGGFGGGGPAGMGMPGMSFGMGGGMPSGPRMGGGYRSRGGPQFFSGGPMGGPPNGGMPYGSSFRSRGRPMGGFGGGPVGGGFGGPVMGGFGGPYGF